MTKVKKADRPRSELDDWLERTREERMRAMIGSAHTRAAARIARLRAWLDLQEMQLGESPGDIALVSASKRAFEKLGLPTDIPEFRPLLNYDEARVLAVNERLSRVVEAMSGTSRTARRNAVEAMLSRLRNEVAPRLVALTNDERDRQLFELLITYLGDIDPDLALRAQVEFFAETRALVLSMSNASGPGRKATVGFDAARVAWYRKAGFKPPSATSIRRQANRVRKAPGS